MGHGLPVIATDVGGNAEAIDHGVNGEIVPPEDPHRLASAILALLQDPAYADRLGRAAKHTVQQRFTVEAMVAQTGATYRQILEQ